MEKGEQKDFFKASWPRFIMYSTVMVTWSNTHLPPLNKSPLEDAGNATWNQVWSKLLHRNSDTLNPWLDLIYQKLLLYQNPKSIFFFYHIPTVLKFKWPVEAKDKWCAVSATFKVAVTSQIMLFLHTSRNCYFCNRIYVKLLLTYYRRDRILQCRGPRLFPPLCLHTNKTQLQIQIK